MQYMLWCEYFIDHLQVTVTSRLFAWFHNKSPIFSFQPFCPLTMLLCYDPRLPHYISNQNLHLLVAKIREA